MSFDVIELTQDMVRLPSLSGQEQAMAEVIGARDIYQPLCLLLAA